MAKYRNRYFRCPTRPAQRCQGSPRCRSGVRWPPGACPARMASLTAAGRRSSTHSSTVCTGRGNEHFRYFKRQRAVVGCKMHWRGFSTLSKSIFGVLQGLAAAAALLSTRERSCHLMLRMNVVWSMCVFRIMERDLLGRRRGSERHRGWWHGGRVGLHEK